MAQLPKRIPTGVKGLDRMLGGGIPQGAWVLATGPPGSGKSTLARQLTYAAANRGQDAFVLSTSDTPETIIHSMMSFGWEGVYQSITLIDGYSWREGSRTAIDLTRLTEASIMIGDIFSGRQLNDPVLVIDSFTDFLLNNDPEIAVRFLSQLKAKLHGKKITALILLEEGVHPSNVGTTIEYVNDGTIRTKYDENGRYIMVSRMLATPVDLGWTEFTIQKGIDIIVRDFFGGGSGK